MHPQLSSSMSNTTITSPLKEYNPSFSLQLSRYCPCHSLLVQHIAETPYHTGTICPIYVKILVDDDDEQKGIFSVTAFQKNEVMLMYCCILIEKILIDPVHNH